MAELITEYVDSKNITHIVQHITLPCKDNNEKEQIIEDLYNALTQKID